MLVAAATTNHLYEGTTQLGLYGAAGTGKTCCLGTRGGLLDGLKQAGLHVRLAATTHIAAEVIREQLRGHGREVEVCTLASALGLREVRVKGERHFRPAPGQGFFDAASVWIVDESSMLSEAVMGYLEQQQQPGQTVIFVGDESQLPPVDDDKRKGWRLSPAMTLPENRVSRLTTVHRYGGPLLEEATRIRQPDDSYRQFVRARSAEKGTIRTVPTSVRLRHEFLAHLRDSADPSVRMLCWTNSRVNYWNQAARDELYGLATEPFLAGMQLLTRDGVKVSDQLIYGTSQQLRVTADAQYDELFFYWENRETHTPWKTWVVEVVSTDGTTAELTVLCESQHAAYKAELKRLAGLAKEQKLGWDAYWTLKDFFADVQYGWASTVHRAQGCSFSTAFIDLEDIGRSNYCENTCRALVYTAVTRARKEIVCVGR